MRDLRYPNRTRKTTSFWQQRKSSRCARKTWCCLQSRIPVATRTFDWTRHAVLALPIWVWTEMDNERGGNGADFGWELNQVYDLQKWKKSTWNRQWKCTNPISLPIRDAQERTQSKHSLQIALFVRPSTTGIPNSECHSANHRNGSLHYTTIM